MPSFDFVPRSRAPHLYSSLDLSLPAVICALNFGREGRIGPTAVHANSRGYRITICGKTVASGRSPSELHASFKAFCDAQARI